ncbi:hypothetical protein QR680_003816 [Steinernema hermaphroditum]|uniref:RING-CH-type domain-containing protein n=1 Tax=Steinernema hermaphroditum TaxID=289476 RepID=A0AA39LSQ6_9BILA|nr:hypothetical protein QR680_003816 [Steinernema hermaphroditum]
MTFVSLFIGSLYYVTWNLLSRGYQPQNFTLIVFKSMFGFCTFCLCMYDGYLMVNSGHRWIMKFARIENYHRESVDSKSLLKEWSTTIYEWRLLPSLLVLIALFLTGTDYPFSLLNDYIVSIMDVSEDACRICYLPSSPEEPLIQPCLCSGTQGYIHEACILRFHDKNPTRELQCFVCSYGYKVGSDGLRIFADTFMTFVSLFIACLDYSAWDVLSRKYQPQNLALIVLMSMFGFCSFCSCMYDSYSVVARGHRWIMKFARIGNYDRESADSKNSSIMDSVEECRICYLPSTDDQPLLHPCLCRGTQKYIHEACILRFDELNPNRGLQCSVCGYRYRFPSKSLSYRIRLQLILTIYSIAMGSFLYAKFHLIPLREDKLLSFLIRCLHICTFFSSIHTAYKTSGKVYDEQLRKGLKMDNYRPNEEAGITSENGETLLSRLETWTSVIYEYRAFWSMVFSAYLFRVFVIEYETFSYLLAVVSVAHHYIDSFIQSAKRFRNSLRRIGFWN